MKKILLITGGTGYIGSHAVIAFEQAWYQTVIIDNLSNSSRQSLDWIEKILGYAPEFHEWDIRDRELLRSVFEQYHFDAVVHFAGLKAVGESCDEPFLYYHNNIEGSITLFEMMEEYGVRKVIFSSSATVYHADNKPPFTEDIPLGTTNPYGTTKLVVEYILRDLAVQKDWSVASLRYFNPIGAHPSGHIGEIPSGIPNNLLPYILDVASGKRKEVNVYGNDYDTTDGTWVRDYIDVCDLVDAHVLAYERIDGGFEAINIGTGEGTSVLQMIEYTKLVSWRNIPYVICPRRSGDIASVYCNPNLASERLGWTARRSIVESIENGWKYIQSRI
jgi:UDP-glucose 4-epimerase